MEVLESARSTWTTSGPAAQWIRAIDVHAAPFSHKPLTEVTRSDVAQALRPLWRRRPAEAAKVRRIWERILDHPAGSAAARRGNAAAWSPALRELLQPPPRGRSWGSGLDDLPLMLDQLRSGRGSGRLALEVSVLTCMPPEHVCRLTADGLRREAAGWTVFVNVADAGGSARPVWRAAALADELATRLCLEVSGGQDPGLALFRSSGRADPLTPKGLKALAQRLFGARAAMLEPSAVREAFRAWSQSRAGDRPAHDVVDAALGLHDALEASAGDGRPTLGPEVRALVLAWQAFLRVSPLEP